MDILQQIQKILKFIGDKRKVYIKENNQFKVVRYETYNNSIGFISFFVKWM